MFNSYNFNQKENDAQNYYYYSEGFSKSELKKIDKGIKKLSLNKASTAGINNKDDIRSSKVRWIPQDTEWLWLYKKLSEYISAANETLWDFDLHHFL